jgi:hypothetical protein
MDDSTRNQRERIDRETGDQHKGVLVLTGVMGSACTRCGIEEIEC